jgi:ferritin-like metal-binding protein YciE
MRKAASHEALGEAFASHLEETKGQVERLEQVFESLDLAKRGVPCEAMEGLIEEGREIIDEVEDAAVRDVGLITAAQKVEHYEIASYGSLIAIAKQLGHDAAAQLLQANLDEEYAADKKLNKLALGRINKKAA